MTSIMRTGRGFGWAAILTLVAGLCCVSAQLDESPPKYGYHNLPQTRFTCEGKLTGRYYADAETDCQMFHVCAKMSRRDTSDFKFLCPNGTVFDQEHQVCADYYQVVCNFNYGSNPLGQVIEIFKLSSKESTNQREFGHVPSRDPDYLGQSNSLGGGGEDFQAAEYNNNKLAASSRNALPYQSSPTKSQSSKESIFYQPQTTRRPTTPFPSTTPRVTRPPPTTTQRQPAPTFSTDFETRAPRPTTTPAPLLFRKPITTEQPGLSKFSFSDFASLSKFQAEFHGAITHAPKNKAPTPTTTERYTTTTYVPYSEYTEYTESTPFSQQYQSTTEPTTRRPPPPSTTPRKQQSSGLSSKFQFTDFASLSKFQNQFHKSFGSPAATSTERASSASSLDFNTRPRSETQAPLSIPTTTRRPSVYQSTFRTTFPDVTTLRPTFQQQPSRFNEEFFRKVESQNEFVKTEDEDDYTKPARRPTTESSQESTEYNQSPQASEPSTSRPAARRGGRRRINPEQRRERQYSRRVQSARFDDKESYAVRERSGQSNSRNEEIFDAEASVFRGPASINNFYNNEGRGSYTTSNEAAPSIEPNQQPASGQAFGRRIRPSQRERIQSPTDSDDRRQGKLEPERKLIKGRRRTSTTEAPQPEFVSPTTYRPAKQFIQVRTQSSSSPVSSTHPASTTRAFISTTTPEPELVTASDEDLDRIRQVKEEERKLKTTAGIVKPTTYRPALLSLKVSQKSSFQTAPVQAKKIEKYVPPLERSEGSTESVKSTENPEYDYLYYDTDDYTDFNSKPDKYGKRSGKVIIAKS